ncbi:hypothetical protein [Shewanella baltica]|uniref:Lipoprotein n=1 Tax=Shewanella baltica (strain OS155 / ATCC BAA-1091) TaxID=325240 RepID=A3D095_SHEB5|nr:hypothetical protein [Shewanella baltica]ABN60158.1 hypothetical protein Sbal_0629 [Shewanella baltica OS155]AEH12555.1 hypothetical protein Sbal117_0769 [Shewanella baltica OS117]
MVVQKRHCFLSFILGCAIITGCSDEAPSCSDDETQGLVIQISKDELKKQVGQGVVDLVTLELTGIRTTDFNEKTGAQECAAELVFSGKNGKDSIDITYKSELVDNEDQFYVTVYGL